MALFQKKSANNPLTALESELAATRRKRDDLLGRRDRIAYLSAEAEEQCKAALLIDDDSESQAALEKAASQCASLASSLRGVDILLGEFNDKVRDLEAELSTGLDRQQREERARALEAKAKSAQAAFDRYLTAADEFAVALEGTGVFEADEIVIWTRRLSHDFKNGRARIFQSIDGKIRSLRADPPKPAVQPEPPPLGEVSPYRRQFSTMAAPGAVGDDSERIVSYYGGLADH